MVVKHRVVDASHGIEKNRDGGWHDYSVALYRRLEDGLVCLGGLRCHDHCVCENPLSYFYADGGDDAYCFHWRETARGRSGRGT